LAATYAPPDPLTGAADRLENEKSDPRVAWHREAHPDQLMPAGEWRVLYLQGGRGAGKTRAGAQDLAEMIQDDPEPGDWGIVAPTYRDAWSTCVEGESGILRAFGTSMAEIKDKKSALIKTAYRTYGEITLHSGHIIRVDSANDGALRVQGKNLKGAWCDEIGLWAKWEVAWDESIAYAVRRGISRIIATGTPKISRPAARLIRRLIRDEEGVIVQRLRTKDNLANLSKGFFDSIVARATGTRLERQELEGELLDDVENALWARELLESIQVDKLPPGAIPPGMTGLHRVCIGADPSDGTEQSDECAYTVSGLGDDHLMYVVESWGGRIGAVPFLKKVVQVANHYHGTVILEKNHGGAYLEATLQQVMRDLSMYVPYEIVYASLGKRTRAEPVAALYERNVVRHVNGPFVELEDQMCTFTGASNERSPDRLDSLVWSATPLLDAASGFGTRTRPNTARPYAIQSVLDSMTTSQEDRIRRRLTSTKAPEGYSDDRRHDWTIESFAPQDDTSYRARPRVRLYR
jgi:phage terminase large subunit-like protein